MTLTPYSTRLVSEADSTLMRAKREEQNGKLGAALQAFRSVVDSLFYLKPQSGEARTHLLRLTEIGQSSLARANDALDRARITQEDTKFDEAARAAREVAEAFAGTAFAQDADLLLREIADQQAAAQQKSIESDATELLHKGEAHFRLGEMTIAEICFRSVIEKYPNTRWSRQAEEKLAGTADQDGG